jgi:hypothetical protein
LHLEISNTYCTTFYVHNPSPLQDLEYRDRLESLGRELYKLAIQDELIYKPTSEAAPIEESPTVEDKETMQLLSAAPDVRVLPSPVPSPVVSPSESALGATGMN